MMLTNSLPEGARFGLIGRSLSHSFSPRYFGSFFAEEGLPYRYDAFELADIGELPALLTSHPLMRGLNVTHPYKREVLRFVHHCSPAVEALGAANVLKILPTPSGEAVLKAYNTDVAGFRSSLLELLGEARPKALVFGTGGAAAAVCYVLQELAIHFRQVSRQADRASLTYDCLPDTLCPDELLWINATPVGLQLGESLPLPYDRLTPAHYVYDLIYNPSPTTYLQEASSRGAKTMDGLQMLYRQADEAWRIWSANEY